MTTKKVKKNYFFIEKYEEWRCIFGMKKIILSK